jgi:heterodisulfide reductase subunit A
MHVRPDARITVYYIDLQIMGKEFRSFFEKTKKKVRFLQGVPDQVDYGWDERASTLTLRSRDPDTGEALEHEFDRVVLSIGIAAPRTNEELARTFGIELDETGFVRLDAAGGFRTSREGVFAAGASTGPTDIGGTRVQSLAAAASITRDMGLASRTATTGL